MLFNSALNFSAAPLRGIRLAGAPKRHAGARRSGCLSTREVNQDDAVTAACNLPIRALGFVRGRSTCPISFLFFRTYSYPRRRQETCPRGKQLCSTAKLDDLFRCRLTFARKPTCKSVAVPSSRRKFGQVLALATHSSA